ncbi:hypothetical protein ACHAXR_013219 [Thalassiosira sp. AJA248-18]
MMRPSVCIHASARLVRRLYQLQRPHDVKTKSSFISSITRSRSTSTSLHQQCFIPSGPFNITHRQLSAGNDGVNGESSPGNDIVDSTAATTQWKRSHYSKIEEKFHNQREECTNDAVKPADADAKSQPTKKPEPLDIDNYEDVQPMWKEMESRVTRRRSLTLEQSGGKSGRRNVRKSDEDMWLEAGVYDSDQSKND